MKYHTVSATEHDKPVEDLTLEELGREIAYRLEQYAKLKELRESVRIDRGKVFSAGANTLEEKRFLDDVTALKGDYKALVARTSDELLALLREADARVSSWRSSMIQWAYIYLG